MNGVDPEVRQMIGDDDLRTDFEGECMRAKRREETSSQMLAALIAAEPALTKWRDTLSESVDPDNEQWVEDFAELCSVTAAVRHVIKLANGEEE